LLVRQGVDNLAARRFVSGRSLAGLAPSPHRSCDERP
jgi:hypothetical protein